MRLSQHSSSSEQYFWLSVGVPCINFPTRQQNTVYRRINYNATQILSVEGINIPFFFVPGSYSQGFILDHLSAKSSLCSPISKHQIDWSSKIYNKCLSYNQIFQVPMKPRSPKLEHQVQMTTFKKHYSSLHIFCVMCRNICAISDLYLHDLGLDFLQLGALASLPTDLLVFGVLLPQRVQKLHHLRLSQQLIVHGRPGRTTTSPLRAIKTPLLELWEQLMSCRYKIMNNSVKREILKAMRLQNSSGKCKTTE